MRKPRFPKSLDFSVFLFFQLHPGALIMDFELELAEQLEEIRAAYGMHVPMSTAIDIEHEETPLEVGYQD